MNEQSPRNTSPDAEIDVVISRVVASEHRQEFRRWPERIAVEISKFPGLLAFKVIEPQDRVQDEFVVMNRWASADDLANWEGSQVRDRLFAEADKISQKPANVQHIAGMQGAFTLPGSRLSVAPKKYQMWLMIFSGLFLLTLAWATIGKDLVEPLPLLARTALIVAINVAVMVYVYLPTLTRVLVRWLSG